MPVPAVLRELLAGGTPGTTHTAQGAATAHPHHPASSTGQQPHTSSVHYSLALLCINHYTIALYFQFTCISLVEPQTCPGACSSSHQPLSCLGTMASCCQGTYPAPPRQNSRAVGEVLPAKFTPRAMPCSPSPDWARRPRSQGLRGRAEPTHLTAPSCVQSHYPASSSDNLVRSISPPGAMTLGSFRQTREKLLSSRPWQAAPTSPCRCPVEG